MPSKLSKKRRLLKLIMRSYKLQAPRGLDLPIRLRPVSSYHCLSYRTAKLMYNSGSLDSPFSSCCAFRSLVSRLLRLAEHGGYLSMAAFISGFTNIADEWPLNDKVLHFICFALATGVFYFVIDVDECVLPGMMTVG